jgi:hypothetical protein
MIPDEMSADDTRLKDRVNIKYACQYDTLSILAKKQVNDSLLNNLTTKIGKEDKISKNEFVSYSFRESRQEKEEEEVKRAVWFISSLSAVDGAVIITDRLRLLGFGAEIIAISQSLQAVKVVTDFANNVGENVNIEHFGTRHRSAFRFCSSLENSVAFIVSQDGEIRVAKRVGPEVVVWSNINVTSSGF